VGQNIINESAFGVLKLAGSVGNVIKNNSYFNSPIKLQDPAEIWAKRRLIANSRFNQQKRPPTKALEDH